MIGGGADKKCISCIALFCFIFTFFDNFYTEKVD